MVRLRITNLSQFEAQMKTGGNELSKAAFRAVSKEAEKFIGGVPAAVERSQKFQQLKSDEDLRGKLGLAKPAFRRGADTDADDLIKLLRKKRVKRKNARTEKRISISLPSIPQLQ